MQQDKLVWVNTCLSLCPGVRVKLEEVTAASLIHVFCGADGPQRQIEGAAAGRQEGVHLLDQILNANLCYSNVANSNWKGALLPAKSG